MNLLDTVDEDFFVLTHEADWSLFDTMAEALIDRTCGKWIQCIDGMDHRYWLLRVDDATIALSLENDFERATRSWLSHGLLQGHWCTTKQLTSVPGSPHPIYGSAFTHRLLPWAMR